MVGVSCGGVYRSKGGGERKMRSGRREKGKNAYVLFLGKK